MTTLTAPVNMLAIHEIKIGQGAARIIEQMRSYPKRVKAMRAVKGRSTVPQVARQDNAPTPERLEHAGEAARKVATTPFNTTIEGALERFRKHLDEDVVMTLARFCELAQRAEVVHGLTAGYSGMSVDQSRMDYQHLSETERNSHADFIQVWRVMGERFQTLALEVLLERPVRGEKARDLLDVGRELCNYQGDKEARAALTTAMRMLSWRISELWHGGKTPVGRASRA